MYLDSRVVDPLSRIIKVTSGIKISIQKIFCASFLIEVFPRVTDERFPVPVFIYLFKLMKTIKSETIRRTDFTGY